ncbi:hypothetical protein LINGRAHAP2_LOCUS28262 [Linum grandiflorum]
MQSPTSACLHLCNCSNTFSVIPRSISLQSFRLPPATPSQNLLLFSEPPNCRRRRRFLTNCQSKRPDRRSTKSRDGGGAKHKSKDGNIWSVDNEIAESKMERAKHRRVKRGGSKRSKGGRVIVSGAMLMDVETVLQTQEPVIRPIWSTFASSLSGIWKGVGAVFSTITAEMEPIDIGKKGEELYDCYTLSRIEAVPSELSSQIQRNTKWATFNPHGEASPSSNGGVGKPVLPKFESFDFDVMEEDVMGDEPGLVFFEDGSYSRGPLSIPVGEEVDDDSAYLISPTFKFEQCLVKGCHKRLRIVHTIQFSQGGADVQILRVAVYEEQWASPVILDDQSDMEFDLEPFSQRRRTRASELAGSWKVFEINATPIFGQEEMADINNGSPYVYLCTETLKKRSLPGNPVHFREEEIVDTRDVTVLWLPGGVTAYVDVNREGVLCIGVGWYSEEGVNLVMERDYELDGSLKEVRSKTEVKRRWSDQ